MMILEKFQGFRCTSCGLCCTRHWGVGVESAVESGIRGSRFYAQKERLGYTPLVVTDGSPTLAAKKEDGSCVFLAEENLCGLHSELGGEGKPVGCQLYPYRLVRTPSGTYASQSFACPPVVAGLDDNVEENRSHLAEVMHRFPKGAAEVGNELHPVKLTQATSISWQSYLDLERRLLDAYETERPMESLLGMANSLLLCERLAGGEPIENWPALPPPPDDSSLEEALIRSYLVAILSMLESEDDLSARLAVQEALNLGEQLDSRLVGGPLPAVDVAFLASSGVRLPQTFHRYFRNCVQGKLLLAPTVVGRLLAMAVGFALLRLYLEGFRVKLGREDDDLEALTLAFEVVEADALSHSDTLDLFFLGFEETLSQLVIADLE